MSETIRVSLQPAQLQASVGGDAATATLAIQNVGLQVDQYNIELAGLEPTWYDLDVTGVALFPQDSNQVKLAIRVPRGVRAGTYPFGVKVTSRANPAQFEIVNSQIEVVAVAAFDLAMTPQKVTGRRATFALTLKNGGNTDLDVNLRGRDPEDKLRYGFKTENPKLAAGSTLEMKLPVSVQRGGLFGEPKSFRFTLTATPTADRSLARTVQGEFVHKPWLRSARPILLPLVLLLVLGSLLLGFRAAPWSALGFGSEAATVTNIFSSLWCRVPFVCPAEKEKDKEKEKEKPYYKEGFHVFHDQDPKLVGDPLANEVADAVGNTYQLTANGTLVWFKAASRPYFFGPEGVYQLSPDGRIRPIDRAPPQR